MCRHRRWTACLYHVMVLATWASYLTSLFWFSLLEKIDNNIYLIVLLWGIKWENMLRSCLAPSKWSWLIIESAVQFFSRRGVLSSLQWCLPSQSRLLQHRQLEAGKGEREEEAFQAWDFSVNKCLLSDFSICQALCWALGLQWWATCTWSLPP